MNKNINRALALFLFIIGFLSTNTFAQKIFFKHYTVMDGLCANTIWDIQQDNQGYMWFGTKYGLSRFDGYNFKSFQHQKGVQGSIGNNFIRKIFKFDYKTFWIGTDEGIFIFDLQTEKFTAFKPVENYFVNDIFRSANGEIWIATKEKGVYRYQPKTKKIINYATNSRLKISSNEIAKIIQDDSGNLWIGTYGKGIDVLNPKTNQLRHYKAEKGSLSSNVILDLYKDHFGNIWIGTMAGGLNVWDKATNTFKTYQKGPANSISDNIVRAIYEPKPGILYLGTEKGLNVLDTQNQQFTVYQNKNNDPFSINDDAVYKVFKDKEGGIWAGTYFGGLNYYHGNSLSFEFYYPSGVKNSLSGNAVSAFLETKPGSIWVGTEDGGLNYFNAADKTFKKFPFQANQDSLSYHNIHALYKDKEGNIWVGMYTGGLNILNPKTGKIKRYKSDPNRANTLSDNSIYSIDEDRQGRIWISTISGLNLYDKEKDSFIRIKGKNLDKSCIYQVYQDKDSIIWIATYDNGLIRMDKNGGLTQFAYSSSSNSISANKVICILDDDEGNLWLGTDGSGLNVLNKKTGKFITYDQANWVKSAVIYGIVKDNTGKMWFSTNNGVFEFDPKSKTNRSFGKWDNLQSQQYNYKAFYKDTSGKLYFGGINGFNSFHPGDVKKPLAIPRISFTNFQLFNKDVEVRNDGVLKRSINYTDEIILAYNQSVLSIEYASLSFIAPNKVNYAFKMEGFDKNWNHVGGQRKATYTNLPPGEYTFMVKELDELSPSRAPVSTLKIVISPPFYKSLPAYMLYLIAIVLGLIWLRKYIYNKERKRNQIKLERLKNKSEQDFYKQKIEFFTAMAHEIRTPLSLIIAPLEKLLGKKEKDPDTFGQLQVMEENSDRLLTLVNQLLDFRRIESDIFEIHVEKIDLVYLVHSIKDRFLPMAEKNALEFSINSQFQKMEVCVDQEAVMKILSNLLINAFKFARKKLEIGINDFQISATGEKMISISIEDDGIGIPKKQLDSIFKKFFKVSNEEHHYTNLGGTGIGLALAKSLTEKHGGSLKVESIEGAKTIFTVLIPFKEEIKIEESDTIEIADNEGQQSVLLVEDDPALLDFLYKSFLSDGYHVVKSKNGAEALKKLDKNHIDIVISDVMMPVMDGIELCKTIKNDINFSHLPVVLLTAKTNTEAEIAGLESGADAYIPKPFKWKQLSLLVKNLLELQSNLKLRFAQNPFETTDILIAGTRDKKFLENITQIIEERISDPQLSVEDLGKELGLSRSSLYKKLKSKTGYVPNEFVRLIRLKAAAKLLTQQEYNISEIGYMVGFSSHSYFSKCFFSQFKLTPSEFAESYKNDATPDEKSHL
ncbi:hybrid sensor histidine kinase/response regulator transcription factor [Pedobacter sandarakinus]|uniref:hybrid sensor histidine kinase/response regulator transcription factor n=1 Tax=Pedobacter sandarakinus TaxID=353156 RepID=UPI00224577E9|nr:hybrid sensor histidine kinase/response regulator transcription factor [Pedobacter sandarakinus]MCX2575161.1 response regulator [Pedobacter sandarakinus]